MNAPIVHQNWHSASGGDPQSEAKGKGEDSKMERNLSH